MNAPLKRDDLLDAYKAASQFDASKPAPSTQDAILSYAARAAKAANISAHIATNAQAQNDRSWRITGTRALGGLMMIGVVGILVMRMFPDLQKQQTLEAPSSVSASQDAASAPAATAAPAVTTTAKALPKAPPPTTPPTIPKPEFDFSNHAVKKSQTPEKKDIESVETNTSVAGTATIPAPVAIADTSKADIRELAAPAAKRMAAPPMAAPAAVAAPAAPAVTAPSMGMAFPASVPNPTEQLLALINDEGGACKSPAPSLDTVRRLLAQGANPSYDKHPLADHGSIARRAQLCGFSDVVKLLSRPL